MEDFIIQIFCLVDNLYTTFVKQHGGLRVTSPEPTLSDSEVMTMLLVKEWVKLSEDKMIYRFFVQHWKALFPQLPSRSQFVRQAANLWSVMQSLQHSLADRLAGNVPENTTVNRQGCPKAHGFYGRQKAAGMSPTQL